MASYPYILPIVSVAPPPGYRLFQSLPLEGLAQRLTAPKARIAVERTLSRDGAVVLSERRELDYADGHWTGEGREFELDGADAGGWASGESVGTLETHVTVIGGGGFRSQFGPPFYTIYAGADRKTFFSDNALKYGNTVIILQIQAFGVWVEGYPASEVDPERNAGESVVLLNPFLRPAVATIELEGIAKPRRVRVNPLSGRRVDLATTFGVGEQGWRGQVLVSGASRLITSIAKHSLSDPCVITTLEHTDPYRGEETFEPMTQRLRRLVGDRVLARLRT